MLLLIIIPPPKEPVIRNPPFQFLEKFNYLCENCVFIEGTIWTAVAHIITGVIGSGVLSLAWAMAQLGWIAGPFLMLFFAAITLFTSFLISDCYTSPDHEHGSIRIKSYTEAVQFHLGNVQILRQFS